MRLPLHKPLFWIHVITLHPFLYCLIRIDLLCPVEMDDLDFDKLSDARPAPNVIRAGLSTSGMRLNDLVERDTILTEDPDGFLRFAYAEDSLFSMTIREFVEIPEQEAMNLENIPILQDSALGFTVEAGLASLSSMELQQLTFDQLGLAWAISTPAQAPVSVRYTFSGPDRRNATSAHCSDHRRRRHSGACEFPKCGIRSHPEQQSTGTTLQQFESVLGDHADPSIHPTGTPVSVRLDFDSTEVNNVTGFSVSVR